MKNYKEFKLLEELTSKEEQFIDASKSNDINTIKKLLPLVDVNIQNNNGYTALIYASYNGNKEIEQPSIDVNIKDIYGYTALIYASSNGYKEVVEMLLKYPSIDVNIKNNYGSTALINASYYEYEEIVEMLIPFLEEDSFVDSFYQIIKDNDFNEIYKKVKEYLGRLKPIYATDIRELIQEILDLNYYKDLNLLIKLSKLYK